MSGRTSVYLSATSRCSIKMAKHNQVNNVIDLQFSDAKILTPMHRPQWGPTAWRELELQQLLDRLNYSKCEPRSPLPLSDEGTLKRRTVGGIMGELERVVYSGTGEGQVCVTYTGCRRIECSDRIHQPPARVSPCKPVCHSSTSN